MYTPFKQMLSLALLLLFLAACSKEPVLSSQTSTVNSNNINAPIGITANSDKGYGMVGGYVFPPDAKPEMVIFNPNYSTGAFYTLRDGSFHVSMIPAGVYTMTVHSLNPIYQDTQVDNIVVTQGNLTKIVINLR